MASPLSAGRNPLESPPGIAALFVIRFDLKAGYVVSWKRSLPDVQVEGVVEYKSLPSGVHKVKEDLIYFVHDRYAGISAYVNRPAAETQRNALMLAVGVLVPLPFGRLGKSWRHAPRLQELAEKYAQDMSNVDILSDYWDAYQLKQSESSSALPDTPLGSPVGLRSRLSYSDRPESLRRSRAFSDAGMLETSKPALTPFHPASSLLDFLDCFGPLVFPLYRAALLRRRILLMADAPVHTPCNYVYDLSLLASLPQALLPLLPSNDLPSLRPRPLFNVGIHDIPFLASFVPSPSPPSAGLDPCWIACTTDSVLSMKPELYDVRVTLPPSYSKEAIEKAYPAISIVSRTQAAAQARGPQTTTTTTTTSLKATQRDARRYLSLRKGLQHFAPSTRAATGAHPSGAEEEHEYSDTESTFSSASIVEPLSWTRLAYTSFIWWASAGEKRQGLSEEEEEEEEQIEQDARLLASVESLPPVSSPLMMPPLPAGLVSRHGTAATTATTTTAAQTSILDDDNESEHASRQPPEIALVAYFRHWTSRIFMVLSDAIARHDEIEYVSGEENDDDGDDGDDGEEEEEGNEPNDAILQAIDVRDENGHDRAENEAEANDTSPLLAGDTRATRDDRYQQLPRRRHSSSSSSEDVVEITTADMVEMGLDVWSEADRFFVQEMVAVWWRRKARVHGARIKCCGLSIW